LKSFPASITSKRELAHGWHRLHPENYPSLIEAVYGMERHRDIMFFEHGEMLPSGIFRIVKCKPRKLK
jgi:hypothetical protein